MTSLRLLATVCAVAAVGCSFDTSGVTFGDASVSADAPVGGPDARVATVDAPPGTPDATIVPTPDASLPDGDNDGVPDVSDNCILDPNPEQYDEDGDMVGDVCDNCPHVKNPLQEDLEEIANAQTADGIGDVCDPRPDQGGDTMVVFDGFNGNSIGGSWANGPGTGSDSWQLTGNGFLEQPMSDVVSRSFWWTGANISRGVVETAFVVDTIAASLGAMDNSRTVAAIGAWSNSMTVGTGYACMSHLDPEDIPAGSNLLLARYDGTSGATMNETLLPWDMVETGVYFLLNSWDGDLNEQVCVTATNGFSAESVVFDDGSYSNGRAGVRTYGIAARFAYVVIYELGN